MRILIARFNHETNTFSPIPTPLASFDPAYDAQAYRLNIGMRTAMAAFIDAANRKNAEIRTPVSATANPSGLVTADAYNTISERIVQAARGCDAILLDLHGAMVAETAIDAEGDLLARVRSAAPFARVGVALDLHGNITEKMVRNADVIIGFKTYPHIDMYETGEHVAHLLLSVESHTVRWRQLPLMSHTLRSATAQGAMQRAVRAARSAEANGIPAVSIFAGFSLADIEAPFVSVVVTGKDTAHGARAAQLVADQIAERIWLERDDFVYRSEPLNESLARAKEHAINATRPVLLLDHGDNCMSGGTCDTTEVLETSLKQGLDGILVGPLSDPATVAAMFRAGVGTELEVRLGNKVSSRPEPHREPYRTRGTVLALSDGKYTISGPIYTGQQCDMGRTALLDIGAAQIVVTERPHEPWDIGVFRCVQVDPRQFRFLLLKSRMYCRPVFEPMVQDIIECDSAGVTSSRYDAFAFLHVRRPAYPLDNV
jgi:microcystin degradation protein MlrC